MHLNSFVLSLIALLPSTASWVAASDGVDLLATAGMQLRAEYDNSQNSTGTCNSSNWVVRKEWSVLSLGERREYIDAVLCLMSTPNITPRSEVPGVRSRYDDFVATHINQTLMIHGTANFLGWHRYFVWTYEQALRNECGYTGYQPYWNWGKYAFNPLNSTLFDGSEFSLSGNGEFVPHNATQMTSYTSVPPGSGGGCVKSGPFKNMTVNLGPVSPTLEVPGVVANGDGFDYNPRCLRRDISEWVSSRWTKDNDTVSLITENDNVYWFQTLMQGIFSEDLVGVHTGGHFTIGGDPAGGFNPTEVATLHYEYRNKQR